MKSEKWNLNKEDFKQIVIKLLMVMVAAGLSQLVEVLKVVDWGQYQTLGSGLIFVAIYAAGRFSNGK